MKYKHDLILRYDLSINNANRCLGAESAFVSASQGLEELATRLAVLREGVQCITDEQSAVTMGMNNYELHFRIQSNGDLATKLRTFFDRVGIPFFVYGTDASRKVAEEVLETYRATSEPTIMKWLKGITPYPAANGLVVARKA